MTEPTDAELIAELEAAGVSFLAFLGGMSGAKKVWTTSGSQDAKKIAAGMRAAIAKWGTPPVVAGEPVGFCHPITWRAHQSEQVQKITREAQPEYGYTQALYTTPQPTKAQAVAVTPPPIECNTEELKRAYAFGWWSALEKQRETAQAGAVPLTDREIELIDGMVQVQLDHASRCDAIANRSMADKQKGWDMERVALLQKIKTHGIKGGQHGADK